MNSNCYIYLRQSLTKQRDRLLPSENVDQS